MIITLNTMKKVFAALLCIALLSGCGSDEDNSNTLVLPYDAFGPAGMSEPLLGQSWWQWQANSDSHPKNYPIKVVIYKEYPLDKVKKRYPVSKATNSDYRYVEYDVAIEYLDKHIEENLSPSTTATLQQTKTLVLTAF